MFSALSPQQKKVLNFIEDYIKEHGIAPTYEIIGKELGYAAKSSVQHHIEALMQKGVLTKERKLSQGMSIHREGNLIPLLGKVAAGRPIDYKNYDERIEVPLAMLKGPRSFFALQVTGDSMIGEGILDGDYVIVRKQETANNGEIVVAEIDDEATIKRFYKKRNHIELRSANEKYKPLIVDAHQPFKISGIYCGLLRY